MRHILKEKALLHPRRRLIATLSIIVPLIAFTLFWWMEASSSLPSHIYKSNGRLSMTRLDIATMYSGKLKELLVHDGSSVKSNDVLAIMDSDDIKAQLDNAISQKLNATSLVERAKAEVELRQSSKGIAELEFNGTVSMRGKSMVSQTELDKRQFVLDGERAGEAAALATLKGAESSVMAAKAQISRLQIALNNSIIRSPIDSRIEFIISEKGSVLPAGGRILSMIDPDNAFLTLFLPSNVAGKVKIGDEAKILLDALGKISINANIDFIASEAQFTPKYVETLNQREKLVYKAKLKISREETKKYKDILKAGMTGDGYVRTNIELEWPKFLKTNADK